MADRTLIVEHDGQPVTVVRHKPSYTQLLVPSSNPGRDPYDVVVTEDGARCTCKGFLHRGKCRHSNAGLAIAG